MEDMVGSQRSNTPTKRKQIRRRSQTRRVLQDSVINMAEARREIVQALQLHRSSFSLSSSSSSSPSPSSTLTRRATPRAISASAGSAEAAASMLGKFGSSSSSQCCYYSLTESMPVPGPIWSTTAPSIPAPSPPAAAATESLEFEWGESQASSYSWWLGFLKTLDGNKNVNAGNSKYHTSHFENFVMGNSRVFGNYQEYGSKLGEATLVDATSDQTNSSPDEWLMFPTIDDNHQGDPTTSNP